MAGVGLDETPAHSAAPRRRPTALAPSTDWLATSKSYTACRPPPVAPARSIAERTRGASEPDVASQPSLCQEDTVRNAPRAAKPRRRPPPAALARAATHRPPRGSPTAAHRACSPTPQPPETARHPPPVSLPVSHPRFSRREARFSRVQIPYGTLFMRQPGAAVVLEGSGSSASLILATTPG